MFATAACGVAESDGDVVRVAAAASLTDVMQRAANVYEQSGRGRVRLDLGASSTLARQIEAEAPCDLFVSASAEWGARVHAARGDAPPVALAGNRLVLVVPVDAAAPQIPPFERLGEGSFERLALADPSHVPAGVYAAAALDAAGVHRAVRDRLVPAPDVRIALAYVVRGEADAAIVYATDARSEPRVRVLYEIPERLHAPIRYVLVPLAGRRKAADAFAQFLVSDEGRAVFAAFGFSAP
jgi:molybdate transport system substrate-binding protein